jgi:hypothetical protein
VSGNCSRKKRFSLRYKVEKTCHSVFYVRRI